MPMKKALQLSGKVNMISQFCIPNIKLLQQLGYSVSVESDFTDPGTITRENSDEFRRGLEKINVSVYDISFPRSLNPLLLYSAYKNTRRIISREKFDLIHCHSPIGAAVCRLAARKERRNGTYVIYTAHGFHFYTGAPLKNWLIYYPVEKILSKHTDMLITINKEDYQRAQRKFKISRIEYVPGVGIDTERFFPGAGNREKIRSELGISDGKIMLLSVGELNKNKNHEMVIRALKGLDAEYVIVGKGQLEQRLRDVAKECGVSLHLTGFRNDVIDFYSAADVYVLPSIREGLNVSLMEAMACGLPVACSNIRGNVDLIDDPLFDPKNESELREAVVKAIDNREELSRKNLERIREYDLKNVEKIMYRLYEGR